jgi:hypothetical protein
MRRKRKMNGSSTMMKVLALDLERSLVQVHHLHHLQGGIIRDIEISIKKERK